MREVEIEKARLERKKLFRAAVVVLFLSLFNSTKKNSFPYLSSCLRRLSAAGRP